MSLYGIFLEHRGNESSKWEHYFPIYENHLQRFVNQSVTLLEIGVFHGGSLQIWRKFLGPLATIVGIDINPECTKYEKDDCKLRIGSQSDLNFLQNILAEFGAPEIVIDDGSHMQSDIFTTFSFLFPQLPNVYIVEDLHTSYWSKYGGGKGLPGTFMEKAKSMVDMMHESYMGGECGYICKNLWNISFYDSVVVFEKKRRLASRPITVGIYK